MHLRRSLRALPLLIALGCGGAYGRAVDRGNELAQQGKWDLAAAEFERAVALDPGNPEAVSLLQWARRSQAWERGQRARALLRRGDAPGALALAHEAVVLDPADQSARQLLIEAAEHTLDAAERLAAAGQKRQALELAALVLRPLPESQRARRLDGALRGALAEEAYQRGDAFARRGQALGNPLIL